ncbi:MAG: lipase [Timaviella obliquedivisa GSE-PSE-MK23-08B]|jgi:lysophospholipase L1-like esterase|nr:lipase [Timaviella obliquedivisa GSE-PSE-MK23-08B]
MHRFQIIAHTQTGESIGLVGSTAELGLWDVAKCIRLQTTVDRYPLWWTEAEIDLQYVCSSTGEIAPETVGYPETVEYKYVRLGAEGSVEWEPFSEHRWIAIAPENQSQNLVVDDGAWGYWQPYPFGYVEAIAEPAAEVRPNPDSKGLKIVVIGSSVACGHKAWLLNGWVSQLGQTLQQQYGHRLVNVSEVGTNVSSTIARFASVVTPEQPDVVIIALSLGNEGLADCPAHQWRAVQRRFESGLQQLVKMTRELGAYPILGGVYPHGNYASEHNELLQETHRRMLGWGIPVLDWLAAVDNGQGAWKVGTSFDPAHPNTIGHRLMYEAIDLRLFEMNPEELVKEKQRFQQPDEVLVYQDSEEFQIFAYPQENQLRIRNASPYAYTITPTWQSLQTALQHQARLMSGLYVANHHQAGVLPFFAVQADGAIETTISIPPGADLEYSAAFNLFSPHNSQLLFYDGNLGILKQDDNRIRVINESTNEYNIQPMWQEVRNALKAMPMGVYEDALDPDVPFRTLMIGNGGLESRVKSPPRSALLFQYKCELSDISRVAILPLGDRCAVRMMLYKMEYDGPAFPFDLTRTTEISDVADMVESRFYDMWNPDFLNYSADAGRIYHRKWTGLSFAHEIDEKDDPLHDMTPVHERMRDRYTARAGRFWYAIQECDKVLFVRTGISDRGGVIDLVNKLGKQCNGRPFHLLLLSPQSSDEFANLPHVLHHDVEFNPDRMYEDLGHWKYCAEVMRGILESLGVSSKNLFWCPPKLPEE